MAERLRVLFLCTGNSARSQMAEGLLQFFGKDDFDAFSAGSAPHGVDPRAVQVMSELGIDIVSQRSKHLNEFRDQPFDYMITLCDPAHEECPAFPDDPERIQWRYPDPVAVDGDQEAQLRAFRKVRDEMSERLRLWLLNQRKLLHERDAGSDIA
jgi:arsenate reductase (thioredoxin)